MLQVSAEMMGKWLQRIGLFLLGLVLAFLILEILTRIFWVKLTELERFSSISFVAPNDLHRLDANRFLYPGQEGAIREFSIEVILNSYGYHDVEHAIAKPEGVFRILVLGDSFTEALQVPLEKAYPRLLEAKLKTGADHPVEVISLGRSGNGTRINLATLEEFGFSFKPDLVIMQFLSNDLIDDTAKIFREDREERNLRTTYLQDLSVIYSRFLLWGGSRFNQVVALKLARLYQSFQAAKYSHLDKYRFFFLNALIFADEYSAMWDEPWKNSERFILQANDFCEKSGVPFVLVSFAEGWRVGEPRSLERRMKGTNRTASQLHWDMVKTDRILRDFCRERRIRFFSLLPTFKDAFRATGKRLHYAYDGHMNEHGHGVAAEAIADYLLQTGLLRKKG
jgi:hypothetical protein